MGWPAVHDLKWFRPPYGIMSLAMASVLDELGYKVILGDVYTNDVGITDDADFHAGILSASTCDGSVIVLHNFARGPTLEVLNTALPQLRQRGFDMLRLTDMFMDEENAPWGPCGIQILSRALLSLAVIVP